MRRIVAAAVAMLAVTGCGGNSSPELPTQFASFSESNATCEDITPGPGGAFSSADLEALQAFYTGTVTSTVDACPTTGRVGTCALTTVPGLELSTPILDQQRYYAPYWTLSAAQADCDGNGGTFTAG